jgi:hypothetical protein
MRRGSIFSGGYQFGVDGRSTDHAQLKRERAIQHVRLESGAEVEIVPLTGGRHVLFDVCARWVEDGVHVANTCIADNELEAKARYLEVVRKLSP